MIERFLTSLRTLAALPAPALDTAEGRTVAAECADATRLELDCPQQELTPAQRACLHRLGDALDSEPMSVGDVQRAVRDACESLGMAAGGGGARAG